MPLCLLSKVVMRSTAVMLSLVVDLRQLLAQTTKGQKDSWITYTAVIP